MAVVWAREHWEGRDGSFEKIVNNTLTRTWKVKTNNKLDDQIVIGEHFKNVLGIQYLTPHPRNGFFTARKLDIKQESASPIFWRVNVPYSTEPLDEDDDEPENPLEKPAEISGDSEMSQSFTTKDKDGKPMLNAAGDPFEPVEKDDPRGVIVIEKNFEEIPQFLSQYINKVNASQFSIPGIPFPFPARTAKFQRFRFGKKQVQNDISFVPVTVEMAIKPDTWDEDRLEEGFHYLDGSERKKITLADGSEPSEPVPLNASGGVLANPSPDNAVYVTKRIYPEEEFGGLFS